MTLVEVHQWITNELSWRDAVTVAASALGAQEQAVLLAYELERVTLAVASLASREIALERAGDQMQLDDPWAVRLFGPRGELRWERAGDTQRAVLLLDQPPEAAPPPQTWRSASWQAEAHDQRYLLWGQYDSHPAAGWTRLSEARTGPLDVPIEIDSGRVQLLAREYLGCGRDADRAGASDPDDLNTIVLAERLVALVADDQAETTNRGKR